jgi:hypothetical protein
MQGKWGGAGIYFDPQLHPADGGFCASLACRYPVGQGSANPTAADDHHAEAAGLPHVSIEIRQDLVDTEDGAERWATILHDALREILQDPELYQVWQSV